MPSDPDADIVEKVRAGFAAFNRGDYDEAVAMLHPDVEYVPVGGQAPLRGRDALRAWMEPSAWDQQFIEPLEIVVAGTKVLMRSRTKARGAGSGIEMEVEVWSVMTVDDDLLVTRMETFLPHEEELARSIAGLGARSQGG
jgi:ketosteroid isomerase-like protein